ncbi:hypothetical protein BDB00DRAFT_788660 [Zychaea mexicana]|uniref:uncharacterized protein n=1 Tax=Zychaea mexicana TaxID=64656 RepID=UPI0022FDB236|nr:uncharacterized protein BDB00DRAFT_788660 [Zychaea mexicana]KAI9492513.1 hypothetical protein BDB00DRAFT_788660 [Zychaea mexicana]
MAVLSGEQDHTGPGAPHTLAVISDRLYTIAVLDGGSTQCLMSKRLAEALGYSFQGTKVIKHNMADRSSAKTVGTARDVKIAVKYKAIVVSADVYDQESYDFLIGRRAMHRLQINTSWVEYG